MRRLVMKIFCTIILYSFLWQIACAGEIVTCKKEDGTTLRSGPSADFDRIAIFPQKAVLPVAGEEGEWYRVRMSPNLELYAAKEDVEKSDGDFSPSILIGIKPGKGEGFLPIEFALDKPCAYIVGQDLFKSAYTLTLFNVKPAVLEQRYPPDLFVTQYDMDLIATDTLRFTLPVAAPGLWGYSVKFEEREERGKKIEKLILAIKKSPILSNPPDFGKITIVIDPGHGGSDSGAIGRDGLKEKDINLKTALKLRELLIARGFKVVMTRETDQDVASPEASAYEELHARVETAEKAMGTVFVSIHFNAMPEVSEGRKAKGTFVYFYHPQSLNLAQSIAISLPASISENNFASIERSFHVIRQTTMPSVLIEGAFISNPDEEKKLAADEYLDKIAGGIFEGIMKFFNSFTLP